MGNFLPNELIERLRSRTDFDSEAFAEIHEREDKVTSVRLNPAKPAKLDLALSEAIPWCKEGYYLADRPVFTLDPLYHAGTYYVQEASSMFVSYIIRALGLDQEEDVRALDLCAAPGGKSTLVNSVLNSSSLLVSNEVIKSRALILVDNLVRWGNPNVVVTNNDPSAFSRLPGYFDVMVVDAPCSGSGMFRKDPAAIDEWSLANVKLCSDRQRRILADAQACLKTDGYLIYSTCSYSEEENEDIVDWLITTHGFESVEVYIEDSWGISKTRSPQKLGIGYRFYPHRVKGEGFFLSVLRKKTSQETFSRRKVKKEKSDVPKGAIDKWVKDPAVFYTFMQGDNIHIVPKEMEEDLAILRSVLYLKNAGTNVGKWSGREVIPAHDLALSNHINEGIESQEVERDSALNFLRKETIDIDLFSNTKNGWCLVRYQGINLGWVKVLPNRINNYYPKEIRIMNL